MSHEIGNALSFMSSDMHAKLGSYYHSLQARYGDPRVYAMQAEEMAAEQAAVDFQQSKSMEAALVASYGKNRDTKQMEHRARMERRGLSKRRESQAQPPPASYRTAQPPDAKRFPAVEDTDDPA